MPNVALLLALAAATQNADFEDLDALDRQVAQAVPSQVALPLDRRLKLRKCPVSPVIEPGIAPVVMVRCVPLGWRVGVVASGVAQSVNMPVIRRGHPVVLIASGTNFEVTTSGVATADAAVGNPTRVKTLTGLVVAGRPLRESVVRIDD